MLIFSIVGTIQNNFNRCNNVVYILLLQQCSLFPIVATMKNNLNCSDKDEFNVNWHKQCWLFSIVGTIQNNFDRCNDVLYNLLLQQCSLFPIVATMKNYLNFCNNAFFQLLQQCRIISIVATIFKLVTHSFYGLILYRQWQIN